MIRIHYEVLSVFGAGPDDAEFRTLCGSRSHFKTDKFDLVTCDRCLESEEENQAEHDRLGGKGAV